MAQPPLCDIYIGLGQYTKAEAMLQSMREEARRLGRPDFEPQVDWSEAELREKQGDNQLAHKNKRKALAYYRKSLIVATRCRKAFAQVKLPYETRVLQKQEQRLKRKIGKLEG
jgi:ATP/maltotriose-dependent transcriptional regulator MalT